MPGPSPQQTKNAISVAEHMVEEALVALREAKKAAYGAAGAFGFNEAVKALRNAGHSHTPHEGDHDVPRGHRRVF